MIDVAERDELFASYSQYKQALCRTYRAEVPPGLHASMEVGHVLRCPTKGWLSQRVPAPGCGTATIQ